MITFLKSKNNNKGEVSVYVALILLMVLLVAAATAGNIALSNLKNADNIENSSKAFYAADTGNEKALQTYMWNQNDLNLACPGATEEPLDPSFTYPKMKYQVQGQDPASGSEVSCPDLAAITGTSPSASLCVYVKGYAGPTGQIVRNVTNSIGICSGSYPDNF